MAPFKLSVFQTINLYAEVLEKRSRFLWAHHFEGGIFEPGRDQPVLPEG